MSTVALGSAKGSPGATTTALALASWWHHPLIVIEADAAGGDIAARCELPEEPGLVGMAAGLRRSPQLRQSPDSWIADHVQETSAGIRVVPAPAGSRQAGAAIELLRNTTPPPSPVGTDLLIDLGRVSDLRDLDSWIYGATSELFIWVCRPVLADLAHLVANLPKRQSADPNHAVVLCGAGPYPADEIASTLDVLVIGHLPNDPQGTDALWSGDGRRWGRSALGRASRNLFGAVRLAIDSEDDVKHSGGASSLAPLQSADQLLPEAKSSAHG
jgi:hypothetical protein